MTLGYGMCAIPGSYDGTGRNTFLINNNGTIFQGDRGSGTTPHMTAFDPTPGTFTPTAERIVRATSRCPSSP